VTSLVTMRVCPKCSAELKAGDPSGLCPVCLLAGAIGADFTSSEPNAPTVSLHTPELAEADSFGPYRILGLLGEGGMGTVYLAEQTEPIRRRVALKVVKLGMDTNQVLARFNHERQALALMAHSNIAGILDAGASSRGRPFFVMDYIEGTSITACCDQRRLTTAQRLELFLPVCRAVQHAHNKGVIHRDIKPSNVLVTEEDGKPVPKVIDFGIARAIEAGDAGNTLATQFGQMVGTPEYASPEQADVVAGEIGAATDVYSLGVLLYELLIGAVPFDGALFRKAGFAERLRIIREEEAPSLVQRLGALGPATAEIAARRGTDAVSLRKLMAGDLNRIVKKALEKSPQQRYASPSELAADVERHLNGEPVRGWSPRRIWPARRSVAAVAAILVLTPAAWFIQRARGSRPQAKIAGTVVLSDVENDTGDPLFDRAFHQSIGFELQRSTNLSVLPDGRVAETLSEMRKTPSTRLTSEIAREICQRTASAAFIESALSNVGSGYLLTLRARNCIAGDLVDEEQSRAAGKDDVLNELRRLTTRLQTKSVASFAALQKKAAPLDAATTSSLEALKSFTAARHRQYEGRTDAFLLYKKAIELDPEFAFAYASLGRAYADHGEQNLAVEYIRKAYNLRGIVSDKESFYITYNYDREVLRNLELCRQVCESWIAKYPAELFPHGLLSGVTSTGTAQYEKAIGEAEKAIRMDPDFNIGYDNIAFAYLCLNRPEEAKATLQRAAQRKLPSKDYLRLLFFAAFLNRDRSAMDKAGAELAVEAPYGDSDHYESLVAAYEGRLRQARQASIQAVTLARQAHLPGRAALFEGGAAVREALYGHPEEASRHSSVVKQLAGGRDADFPPAFALALSRKTPAALISVLTMVTHMEKEYPEDTCVRFSYSPALRALLAINEGRPEKAIELLTVSKVYELAQTGASVYASYGALYPTYVRGLAYRQLHKNREAAAEFQRMLDHPGLLLADAIGPAARLQLARALRDAGETARAKAAYGDFLALWKDADQDIPLLQQARAEFASL
jgi:serine/threonine protein kinase/Tfp pilus assembly protein PilF